MNLAWIVAVLRPLDIAPHPNFRDPNYDTKPHAQLAGLVSGDPHRYHYPHEEEEGAGDYDPGVRYAGMSLTTGGIREGLDGLIEEALSEESTDHARRCVLGLLACCAAAEVDEYDKCESILQALLGETSANDPEGKLIRAILLQQQSLRFRDSGRKHTSQTAETLRLLDEIESSNFSQFPMSPGARVDHRESLRQVIISLRHAAWSLVPMRLTIEKADELPHGFPTWQEMVRTQKSNQALKIDQLRASEYSKFVEDSFKNMFRSQTRTIGGRGAPTLFHAALNFELLADSSVYRLRKENALMKLIQYMSAAHPNPDEIADSLRLLRHSNAKSEIDLAVERIRARGPLDALKKDSAQIVRNRSEPRMLRAAELRILRGAADLMTQAEARSALAVICRVIEAGGSQPAPDSLPLDVVRLESAWLTASHLANIAEEDEEVALILLEAAHAGRPGDELWDKAIGRSLRNLNWENVSPAVQTQWSEFFARESSRMPASRSVFEALALRESLPGATDLGDLEGVASRVNAAMGGTIMSDVEVAASIETVGDSLARIRAESSGGVYSFRVLDPADVAAALIVHAEAADLWPILADFLTDRKVQRSDKSAAFDRLSYSSPEIPSAVADIFFRNARALLEAPGSPFEDDAVVPFPAALRFLASHQVIEEPEAFSLIAQMAGRGESESREQASRSVATLVSTLDSPWLLSQAMQLSHDSEPAVRAHAARALSLLSFSSSEFRKVAESRLVEMMGEEGILLPTLVIRQMAQADNVPDSVKRAIGDLVVNHPSAMVRREARTLLGEGR